MITLLKIFVSQTHDEISDEVAVLTSHSDLAHPLHCLSWSHSKEMKEKKNKKKKSILTLMNPKRLVSLPSSRRTRPFASVACYAIVTTFLSCGNGSQTYLP